VQAKQGNYLNGLHNKKIISFISCFNHSSHMSFSGICLLCNIKSMIETIVSHCSTRFALQYAILYSYFQA